MDNEVQDLPRREEKKKWVNTQKVGIFNGENVQTNYINSVNMEEQERTHLSCSLPAILKLFTGLQVSLARCNTQGYQSHKH